MKKSIFLYSFYFWKKVILSSNVLSLSLPPFLLTSIIIYLIIHIFWALMFIQGSPRFQEFYIFHLHFRHFFPFILRDSPRQVNGNCQSSDQKKYLPYTMQTYEQDRKSNYLLIFFTVYFLQHHLMDIQRTLNRDQRILLALMEGYIFEILLFPN